MENTDCCSSYDEACRMKRVTLFGKSFWAKNNKCSNDGKCYKQKEKLKLNLSILPVGYCNGSCAFCSAKDSMRAEKIDIRKLERVTRQLAAKDIVRGVSITGGEPFLDVGLLNETINIIFDILGPHTEVAINTNGSGLGNIHKLERLADIDTIHISRHHYDDTINANIFGSGNIPTTDEMKRIIDTVSFKDIFVFNCLLMKNYIGSTSEVCQFLDYAISVGVSKVGFITAMEVNDFAVEQKVSFTDVIKRDDSRFLFTRGFYDYDICHCQDGIYASGDGRLIEIYGREVHKKDCAYSRGLVYGSDNHLRTGYSGEIII